jgi:hypothetical protein
MKVHVGMARIWTAVASEARHRFGEWLGQIGCALSYESAVAAALCRRSPKRARIMRALREIRVSSFLSVFIRVHPWLKIHFLALPCLFG